MITFQQAVEWWGKKCHIIDDQRFIAETRLVGLVLAHPVNDVYSGEFYLDFDNGYRAVSTSVRSLGEDNPDMGKDLASPTP